MLQARDRCRGRRTCSSAAISSSPASRSTPGVPGVPAPAARGRAADPADVRPLAGRPQVADDGARRSSTASGRPISAPASSARARTSARSASRRRIPSCSTGWPSSSWTTAGASKHLHRLIVTSATYRQSSRVTPELLAARSRTTGCWRAARGSASRPRSSATSRWRPAACSNPRLGGPSVFPPAPAFLFQPPASYGPKVWNEATGADRYRRALYTFRYRSVPYPALQTFDAPNGDFSCVRRARSNTPLQALTTLNEPLFLECARALALKTLREGGPTDARPARRTPSAAAWRGRRRAAESAALLDAAAARRRSGSPAAKPNPWELAAGDPSTPPQLPAGVDAGAAGRLDGRLARAVEPRRDDHEGIDPCQDSIR